jgi:hypothetical protein
MMQPFGGPLDLDTSPLGPPIQMPAPKKKGGMFGAGKGENIGNAISAAIFGALAARGNPAGTMGLQQLHAMRQRKQESEAESAQYSQRREDGFSDWVRKQAYEAANPSPVNNDTVQDYNFWKGVLPPEQFNQWVESKVNPPQLMNVPGVGIVQVPRMGGGQAPTAPVGKLTPIEEGGPMPSASGGFPPSGY